jgi:hypothetical protein
MAWAAKRVHIGEIICNSFARLGDVYVVQIEHKAPGNEWVLVGEELGVAMDQCSEELSKPSVAVPTSHDELVEA